MRPTKEGLEGPGQDGKNRLLKCSEYENPQISTNPRLQGGSKHNIKYSEDFKRTLAFVAKH